MRIGLSAVWPKTRRSAGVRVTTATWRLIRSGDTARGRGHWQEAAALYAQALDRDPALHHVRIQQGHMLKEAGRLPAADAAYAEAARRRPDDAEPLVHRAYLARRLDGGGGSMALFLAALARGDWQGTAERAVRRALSLDPALSADAIRGIHAEVAADPDRPDDPPTPPAGDGRPLVFDVTDLVGYFRERRSPTGIQRVQIEALKAAFRLHGAAGLRLGSFVRERDDMAAVPVDAFLALANLAGAGGDGADPVWQRACARVMVRIALAPALVLPAYALFINLGTSLWVSDYFRFIRNAKAVHGISYIPFVHDLIPALLPRYCRDDIRQEFDQWLAGLFHHADGFLTNSRSTADDLGRMAGLLGHTLSPDQVEVVPLDADCRPDIEALPEAALARWDLAPGYVLLVSTIEPRKNHLLAFEAWVELIQRHGPAAVPRLVCVGRDGWLNDAVFARLAASPTLIASVTIVHAVSDAELALLYRCSRFTLYPSHYEGWGLPVTESLCHGKLPVIADNSSLPEAGAGLALIFADGSLPALVHAVERAAFDGGWRLRQEARIAAEFRPRAWAGVAAQIIHGAARLAGPAAPTLPVPIARMGAYHPVGLRDGAEIWPGLASGEVFRIGEGWRWPEADGCRTTAAGGRLLLRINPTDQVPAGPVRLHLRVAAADGREASVLVQAGQEERRFALPGTGTIWATCALPAGSDTVCVTIRGVAAEEDGDGDTVVVVLVGLFLSEGYDPDADQRAMASIDGWREPRDR